MRTQVMQEIATAAAWLLQDSGNGSVEKTVLHSFPFTIGRNDSADLQVDSSQVSREHAVITRKGKKFFVRDLGSTNGTFLNGEQIEESQISDGDILVIAKFEFTFCSVGAPPERATATQVIKPSAASTVSDESGAWETVRAIRRTQEMTTSLCVRALLQPVVEVSTDAVAGYEALGGSGGDDPPTPRCDSLAAPLECRANDRMRRLFRRLAVEDTIRLPHPGKLFLAITAAETVAPSLVDHLLHLRELLSGKAQLVVEVPDSAVRTIGEFRELFARLRELQIQVAYDGYASGKAQVTERKEISPDYLKLAPLTLKSIHRGKERQRQVELLIKAAHDYGSSVIATGVDEEADWNICRQLRCNLAQGSFVSPARTVSSLIRHPRVPARASK